MLISQTAISLLTLLFLMIPGIVFRKKGILNESQNNGLNAFVVNAAWPCMVINAMQIDFDISVLKESGNMMGKMLIIFAIICFLCLVIAKCLNVDRKRRSLFIFMSVFGNTGFIGIPLVQLMCGEMSAFYASILEAANDILIFTFGIFIMQKASEEGKGFSLKNFLNPCFIGSVIGLILFVFQIKLPGFIAGPVEMLSSATTPVAMIVLGFQLGGLKLKDFCGDKLCYATVLMKLVIAPLITFAVLKIWASSYPADTTLLIDMGMPVAVMSALLSQKYDNDTALATKAILISTLGLFVSVPLCTLLISLL